MKRLVMDLGMHDGQDTRAYLAQGYRVVAVEANPRHVIAALKTFAREIACGKLTIVDVALAPADGEMPFYVNEQNDLLASLHHGHAARGGAACVAVPVVCLRPAVLFERYGIPHYLKVDIEGMDRCVLDALAEIPDRPRFISIEITHPSDVGAMSSLGYDKFQLVNQRTLPPGNPSGPFGDALQGPWVPAEEALTEYAAGRVTDPLAWFDLHGRRAA